MARNLALWAADPHLQPRTWKHRPIDGDAFFSFEQLIDRAITLSGTTVVLAGDIVNAYLNEDTTAIFLRKQLSRLTEAGQELCYVVGQHDGRGNWPKLGDCAVHVDKTPFEIGDILCYGLDFQPADQLKQSLAEMPKATSLLLAHQVWSDFMGDNTFPQGEFADIPGHIKTLVTGDYHKWVLSSKKYRNADGALMTVLSPGATHQTPAIDSPNECFYAVLQSDGMFRKEQFVTRCYREFAIQTAENLDKFLAEVPVELGLAAQYAEEKILPEALKTPLWRIVYSHKLSDVPQRVAKMVRNGQDAHLFWKEIAPEKEESQIQAKFAQAEKGKTLTLQTCLPLAVDPKQEPAVFGLCQRMLDATDPAVELVQWKKEILSGGTDSEGG